MFMHESQRKPCGPLYYVGNSKEGRPVSQSNQGDLMTWDVVELIPKPRYKPFTRETIPKLGVIFWDEKSSFWRSAHSFSVEGVCFSNCTESYKSLLRDYKMSLDEGRTWLPAGEKVTE